MDIKEKFSELVDYFQMLPANVQWRILVNMIMNFRVSKRAGNFCLTWATTNFSRRTVFHIVVIRLHVNNSVTSCHCSCDEKCIQISTLTDMHLQSARLTPSNCLKRINVRIFKRWSMQNLCCQTEFVTLI